MNLFNYELSYVGRNSAILNDAQAFINSNKLEYLNRFQPRLMQCHSSDVALTYLKQKLDDQDVLCFPWPTTNDDWAKECMRFVKYLMDKDYCLYILSPNEHYALKKSFDDDFFTWPMVLY